MALTGEQKRLYMRIYRRRQRAGLPPSKTAIKIAALEDKIARLKEQVRKRQPAAAAQARGA